MLGLVSVWSTTKQSNNRTMENPDQDLDGMYFDPVILEELQFGMRPASWKMFLQTNFDLTASYNQPHHSKHRVHKACSYTCWKQEECLNKEQASHIQIERGISQTSYSHLNCWKSAMMGVLNQIYTTINMENWHTEQRTPAQTTIWTPCVGESSFRQW